MSVSADYRQIVSHYEACFEKHGDSCHGVDWPNSVDAETRYRVMLELTGIPGSSHRLLDVGCGAGHLLEYIRRTPYLNIDYTGIDLSPAFVEHCRKKFPNNKFYCLDVLLDSPDWNELPAFDFAVLNGVFTERRSVAYADMLEYMLVTLTRVFEKVKLGLAFNVMSKHVDWERDDLFHVPYDELATELRARIGRHFVFRSDYGLYEFTTYLYRTPR